jgi:predicted nucleotidyltransferase
VRRTLDDVPLRPNERAALEELRRRLHQRFGDRVVKLAFFGSRARGEGDEESDLDVAVVIRGYEPLPEIDEVDEIVSDASLTGGVCVNTVRFDEMEYEDYVRRERPIVTAIETEGVPL